MSKQWKNVEKAIAKLFGGKRVGVTGLNTEDVEHDIFSIEVKHRLAIPKWLMDFVEQAEKECDSDKLSLVIIHGKNMKYEDNLAIIRVGELIKLISELNREYDIFNIRIKRHKIIPHWLMDFIIQAEANSNKDKLPLVVFHGKNMKYEDSLGILRVKDLVRLVLQLNREP